MIVASTANTSAIRSGVQHLARARLRPPGGRAPSSARGRQSARRARDRARSRAPRRRHGRRGRAAPSPPAGGAGSSDMVGSSASRIGACVASARASATRARSPPESVVTARAAHGSIAVAASAPATAARSSSGERREGVGMGMPPERHHRGDAHRPMEDMALRQIGDVARAFAHGTCRAAVGPQARCGLRPARGRRARASAWSCRRRWGRSARSMRRLEIERGASTTRLPASRTETSAARRIGAALTTALLRAARRSEKIIARKNGTPISAVTTPTRSSSAAGSTAHRDVGGGEQRRARERAGQQHARRIGADGAAHQVRSNQPDEADGARDRHRRADAERDADHDRHPHAARDRRRARRRRPRRA